MIKKVSKYLKFVFMLMPLLVIPAIIENIKLKEWFELYLKVGFLLLSQLLYILYTIKARRKVLSVNDLKYEDYYRDIIRQFTPAQLSLIDEKILYYPNVIMAELLNFEKMNIIQIKDQKITILKDYIFNNASQNLLYKLIKEHKYPFYIEEFDAFNELVIKESHNKGLINIDNGIHKDHTLTIFIITIIILIICLIIMKYIHNPIIFGICAILGFSGPLIVFIRVLKKALYFSKIGKYTVYRTDYGKEINIKLEGLKNFIKDFSILNKEDKDKVFLYEDYLIYSVLFAQNLKIFKELSFLFNDLNEEKINKKM